MKARVQPEIQPIVTSDTRNPLPVFFFLSPAKYDIDISWQNQCRVASCVLDIHLRRYMYVPYKAVGDTGGGGTPPSGSVNFNMNICPARRAVSDLDGFRRSRHLRTKEFYLHTCTVRYTQYYPQAPCTWGLAQISGTVLTRSLRDLKALAMTAGCIVGQRHLPLGLN